MIFLRYLGGGLIICEASAANLKIYQPNNERVRHESTL